MSHSEKNPPCMLYSFFPRIIYFLRRIHISRQMAFDGISDRKTSVRGLTCTKLHMGSLWRALCRQDGGFQNSNFPGFHSVGVGKCAGRQYLYLFQRNCVNSVAYMHISGILEHPLIPALTCHSATTSSNRKEEGTRKNTRITTAHPGRGSDDHSINSGAQTAVS